MQPAAVKGSIIVSYIVLVVGFTTIAVWDVAKIISDYINDNRLTIVKRKNAIADGMPFLEDLTMCLYYDSDVLVPVDEADLLTAMMSAWDIENGSSLSDIQTDTKSMALTRNMLRVLTAGSIVAMDSSRYAMKSIGLPMTDRNLTFFLDSVISQPNSAQKILEAWTAVQHGFVKKQAYFYDDYQTDYNISLPNGWYFLEKIVLEPVRDSLSTVCFILPISNVSLPVQVNYRFDAWPPVAYREDPKKAVITRLNAVSLYNAENSQLFRSDSDVTFPMDLYVTISNVGCFDTTQLPPCQQRFDTEQQCLAYESQRIIEHACQCKQFSGLMEQVLHENKTDGYSGPYCTSAYYSTCLEEADKKALQWRTDAVASGICRPCFSCKNSYQFSAKEGSIPGCSACMSYLYLKIVNEQFYLVYDDRPQFTLAQLISQIGGELGLYIGFSMLSLLQFTMFVYQMQEQRRDSQKDTSTSDRIVSKISAWFRYFVQYSVRNLHDLDRRKCTEQHDAMEKLRRDLAAHMREVNEKLEAYDLRIRQHIDEKFEAVLIASKGKRFMWGYGNHKK